MKMRSLPKYVCSRQAQSANYEMKKPSNKAVKDETGEVNRKKSNSENHH